MLINKDGIIDESITMIADNKDNWVLTDNQFLQISKSGKTVELWQGKEDYLNDTLSNELRVIKRWRTSSIIGYY